MLSIVLIRIKIKRIGSASWHSWTYNRLQQKKQESLRKPIRAKKPQARRGRAKAEEKKEEEVKEPEHFGLSHLQKAFTKFMAAGTEVRTLIRKMILENLQKFIFIFSKVVHLLEPKKVERNLSKNIQKNNRKTFQLQFEKELIKEIKETLPEENKTDSRVWHLPIS